MSRKQYPKPPRRGLVAAYWAWTVQLDDGTWTVFHRSDGIIATGEQFAYAKSLVDEANAAQGAGL